MRRSVFPAVVRSRFPVFFRRLFACAFAIAADEASPDIAVTPSGRRCYAIPLARPCPALDAGPIVCRVSLGLAAAVPEGACLLGRGERAAKTSRGFIPMASGLILGREGGACRLLSDVPAGNPSGPAGLKGQNPKGRKSACSANRGPLSAPPVRNLSRGFAFPPFLCIMSNGGVLYPCRDAPGESGLSDIALQCGGTLRRAWFLSTAAAQHVVPRSPERHKER